MSQKIILQENDSSDTSEYRPCIRCERHPSFPMILSVTLHVDGKCVVCENHVMLTLGLERDRNRSESGKRLLILVAETTLLKKFIFSVKSVGRKYGASERYSQLALVS